MLLFFPFSCSRLTLRSVTYICIVHRTTHLGFPMLEHYGTWVLRLRISNWAFESSLLSMQKQSFHPGYAEGRWDGEIAFGRFRNVEFTHKYYCRRIRTDFHIWVLLLSCASGSIFITRMRMEFADGGVYSNSLITTKVNAFTTSLTSTNLNMAESSQWGQGTCPAVFSYSTTSISPLEKKKQKMQLPQFPIDHFHSTHQINFILPLRKRAWSSLRNP